MANQQFSSARFRRLIKAYFNENGRMLYRALVAYFILSFAIWMIVTSLLISNDDSFNIGLQIFLFVLNGFIFPILVSGWFYGRLNSSERQISFLVVPATHMEKHVLSTLMSIVVPLIIGIGTYYIGEICGMALHNNLAKPGAWHTYYGGHDDFYGTPLIKEVFDSNLTTVILFTYLSFFLFGSTFFQFFTLHFTRFVIFKIALLALALFTIIALYIYVTLESMNISDNALFRYMHHLFNVFYPFSKARDCEVLLFAIPCLVSALVLWFCSYIRLKEYQLK